MPKRHIRNNGEYYKKYTKKCTKIYKKDKKNCSYYSVISLICSNKVHIVSFKLKIHINMNKRYKIQIFCRRVRLSQSASRREI